MQPSSFKYYLLSFAVIIATGLSASLIAQDSQSVPTRAEVEEQFTWDLSALFDSDKAWEEAFKESEKLIAGFSAFDGKLGKSPKSLLGVMRHYEKAGQLFSRLNSYASRKGDQDQGNTTYQAMVQRMGGMSTRFSQATAFMNPEITDIQNKSLKKFMKKEPGLDLYQFYFNDLRRSKAHILSKEQEELLALTGDITNGPYDAFSLLTNTDFKWGMIKDTEGAEVQMSRGRYGLYMNSPDRRLRHDAYKELYVPYSAYLNTLTSLLNSQLKRDVFYAKARKYPNALAASLDGPNIPAYVYHKLISTIHDNLDPLHRWAGIKKRVLGIDMMHPYDTYAPLFDDVSKLYTWEEAKAIVLEALSPMGAKVRAIIEQAYAERWIDVYENQGKRSGAYMSGIYGVHPYILLNFNGTLDNVFTLAHELGHAIHSYLSNEKQPYIYYSYATFNAEVASMGNEAFLMDYLLAHADSDAERLSLLQNYVQDIGSSFYRQARFAEFELIIHEMVEQGEPITKDRLNEIFGDLYQAYWGSDMEVDEEENLSWSRIPHYYFTFYMYNYSTSFAAGQVIARKIRENGQPAIDDFLQFLSMGGSGYPIDLLKMGGADMSTPAPIEATAQTMTSLLDQIEAILDKQGK